MRSELSAAVRAAQAHQARIDELWDFNDVAASEARFTAAAYAAEGVERDIMLTQVARAYGLGSARAAALELLSAVEESIDSEVRVRVLLERGRALNTSGDRRAARPLFEAARAAANDAGFEHLECDALHMVAIAAPAEEQDALNRRALGIATATADPRARQWRASLLNNIGWTAFDRGDYSDALALFEEALAARLAQGTASDIQVARWCVGRTLRALGRLEEALAIQRSLAAEHAAAGSSDQYVDEELQACERELAEGGEGRPESQQDHP